MDMDTSNPNSNSFTAEPVGRSFLLHYLHTLIYEERMKNMVQKSTTNNNTNNKNQPNNKSKKNKNKNKKGKKNEVSIEIEIDWDCELDDFYALLGIKRYEAQHISEENIKKAYRKVSLLCHPDKAPAAKREESENRYKMIQKAYETLSDPELKIAFDSAVDFDDSIPLLSEVNAQCAVSATAAATTTTAAETAAALDVLDDDGQHVSGRMKVNETAFYELFAPYFQKWSRFGIGSSVPLLGNAQTSDNRVKKFYNYWRNFKSWRVFYFEDEISANIMDLKNAENGKERKWMMKENNALQAPFKKAESLNIQSLIQMAYERDPRIGRLLIKEKQVYLRQEREMEERRLRKEREIEAKQERYEQKLADIQRQLALDAKKKEREMNRKRNELIQLPLRLRNLCNTEFFINAKIKPSHLDTICFHGKEAIREILTADTNENKLQKLNEVYKLCKKKKKLKEKAEEQKRIAESKLRNLKLGFCDEPWTHQEINNLVIAVGKYPGGTTNRWIKIERFLGVGNKTKRGVDEIIQKFKSLTKKSKSKKKSNASASATAATKRKSHKNSNRNSSDDSDSDSDESEGAEEDEEEEEAQAQAQAQGLDWTKGQQKQLENALKNARSMPVQERWDFVASKVDGKNKVQCVERFKWIRQQLLKKQGK